MSWDELLARGRELQAEPESRPQPEDLCTIMYTSGTTGEKTEQFTLLQRRHIF
jgi:long-chain acyl-CoA synthetase